MNLASFASLVGCVAPWRRIDALKTPQSVKEEERIFFSEEKKQKTFMSCALLMLSLSLPGIAAAEVVTPPAISPPDTWVQRQAGTLRVLNKLDSTVQTLTLHVGVTTQLQSLTITLEACAVRPPDLPADASAHLKVTDSRPDQPGYDGWILQQEPAINLFEHPVYDIQLAGCN
jgi:hypothetical protein